MQLTVEHADTLIGAPNFDLETGRQQVRIQEELKKETKGRTGGGGEEEENYKVRNGAKWPSVLRRASSAGGGG